LEASPYYYDPQTALAPFILHERNDLYEEKAVLLARIQHHEQALSLIVYSIGDFKMAEEYCKKYYDPKSEEGRKVYLALLQVCLNVPGEEKKKGVEKKLDLVFDLLNKYHDKINASEVLDLLPDDTPVQKLANFLESALRSKTRERRELQVVKNLLKLENLRVRDEKIKASSRVIKIYKGRLCPVCKKEIKGSVFTVYPGANGAVVHYMCAKNKNICPVTGTDFSKVLV